MTINLQKAYNHFFRSPGMGFPKFKTRHKSKKSYTTNCVNGNISIENGFIKLPKVGLVKLKQHKQIPEGYKLKSVTVSQALSGKYHVSVLFEYENQVSQIKPQIFLGLDFSMHELYKDSNGNELKCPRYYRQAEKSLQGNSADYPKCRKTQETAGNSV